MAEGTPLDKRCTKCDAVKPVSEFGKLKHGKHGLNPWCKACNRANANAHRLANLALTSEKRKAQYRADPEPARHRARTWARQNPATVKAMKRRYYVANRERLIEYTNIWVRENPGRVREIARAVRAKKPDQYRALAATMSAARRAREASAPHVPFTREQLAQRLAYYGNRCWMCGQPGPTVDHVKPLVAGGSNMLANLRPACKPCNSSKSGRWPYKPPTRIST